MCIRDRYIQFMVEIESNNEINFLDLTLIKQNNKFRYKIFRKPTAADGVIHADSFHPISQKMAAFNSLIHRLHIVPLDPFDYAEEVNVIKHIAVANGYHSSLIERLIHKHKYKTKKPCLDKTNMKYISVDYTNNLPMI